MTQTKEQDTRAEDQAKAQFESIEEMVEALHKAEEEDNEEAREEAMQTIQEDPLSVQIRGDWHNPGESGEATEYEILLCWGGPAVRIRGELSKYNEPKSATIQYQDWFTKWVDYSCNEEILLEYARQFYFEG